MCPLLQTVTEGELRNGTQLILLTRRLCFYNFGDFLSSCWASQNVLITPSIKPLCSSHGSGCKREVAFISPFIPHSSAGERGGFSKPGGKLTSITLVRPFKALNFLSKYASSIDVSLHCGMQNLFRWTYLKILAFFPPMPETIFSGVLGIIQSLLMVRRV